MTDADHFFDPLASFRAEKERAATPSGKRVSRSVGQRVGATSRWAKLWLRNRLVHRADATASARHRANHQPVQVGATASH